MVNISKQVLSHRVRKQVLHDLLVLVSDGGRTKNERLWQELMTEQEQMQYAKRVALVVLLARGVSYGAIEKTLKMSPATIAKHDRMRMEGKYRTIEVRSGKPRVKADVLDLLDKLLRCGMPGYCDRHRHLWLLK